MVSLIDRVFTPKKREGPEIGFTRARSSSDVSLRLEEILNEILAGIEIIGKRLDAIEQTVEELKRTKRTQ